MSWTVYLGGEIHTNWREVVKNRISQAGLDARFTGPVTDHAASDACGTAILGPEDDPFWHDHKAAKLNAIRTRRAIREADLAVVRFGDQYKQWNAAFDAGFAVASGTPLVTLHAPDLRHALKEIDAAAMATAEHPEQIAEILVYLDTGVLPGTPA